MIKELTLPKFNKEDLRNHIEEIESFGEFFWVASIKKEKIDEIIFHIESDNLEEVTKYNELGDDMVNVLICKIAEDKFQLVLIYSPKDLYSDESCIYKKDVDLIVNEKPKKTLSIEEQQTLDKILDNKSPTVWGIIKECFKI